MSGSEPVRVCSVSDLADDTALGVEVGGEPVCVVRSGGRVFALRDVCSHAEVMLSQGEVEDGRIECWLHGSQFDLETGRPLSLPANEPVPTYAVVVDGDDVFVGLEPAHAYVNAPAHARTTRQRHGPLRGHEGVVDGRHGPLRGHEGVVDGRSATTLDHP